VGFGKRNKVSAKKLNAGHAEVDDFQVEVIRWETA